jgi:hypothetical protein
MPPVDHAERDGPASLDEASREQEAEAPPQGSPAPSPRPSSGVHAAMAALAGRARNLVKTWPRALLLAGLVLCAWPLLRAVPRTHPVRLRISRPDDVTRIELVWLEPTGDHVLRRVGWGFAPGRAPTELATELSVSPGSYRAQLRVERGQVANMAERTVLFEANDAETVLPVE